MKDFQLLIKLLLKISKELISYLKLLEEDIQLALVPLILLTIFIIISILNANTEYQLYRNKLFPVDVSTKVNPYPMTSGIINPPISAKAAIVMDDATHVVLFEKNPAIRFSMASTTKIMTALVALDYYKTDSLLTVKTATIEGSLIGLQVGETFRFKDLLYAMLLPSANDAAIAIADNYPGGLEAFVNEMNAKAFSLHLLNTHYADPAGLDDDGNYTTVTDLAQLASFAERNPLFAKVTSTRQTSISTIDNRRQFILYNLNKLLGTNGIDGIKTGTTEGAGEVLVTSEVTRGHRFIIIVMKSEDRFLDTLSILSAVNNTIGYLTPLYP